MLRGRCFCAQSGLEAKCFSSKPLKRGGLRVGFVQAPGSAEAWLHVMKPLCRWRKVIKKPAGGWQ